MAAALCFAGGLAVAKFSRPDDPTSANGNQPQQTDPQSPRAKPLTALSTGPGGRRSTARQFAALNSSPDYGLYQRMSGFFRLISEADPDEMPALIQTILREMPEDLGGEVMVAAAAARWAEQDPQGALRAMLDGKFPGSNEAFEIVLKTAAKQDPRGAWQQFLEADEEGRGKLANQQTRDRIVAELLTAIGKEDIDLTIDLFESSGNSSGYRAGLTRALKEIAAAKPIEFLDRLDELPFYSASHRRSAIEKAFQSIGSHQDDFTRALERLENLDGAERRSAETGLARSWAIADPTSALQWADGLGLDTQQRAKAVILNRLADKDPVAAAEAVTAQSNPAVRSRAAAQVAGRWVRQDRDAALVWVREELEGEAQHNSYTTLLEESLRKADFEKDFEILKEMADGAPGSSSVHYQFARRWAGNDPQAAAQWAVLKSKPAFSAVARQWARSDPEALKNFSATLEDEGMLKVAAEHRGELASEEAKP